uniref:Uncharacterized protein n=1 Tax=Glossina austeni TaxID=7395 RepID=A0A1A9UVU9_GLOAU
MDPSGGMSNNYFTATHTFIHWASGCSYNVPARQDLLLLLFLFWLLYGEAIGKVAIVVAAAASAASAASAVNVADEIGINLPAEILLIYMSATAHNILRIDFMADATKYSFHLLLNLTVICFANH